MSVAITSDIHLGNPDSRLSDGTDFYPYGFYKDFREAIFSFTGTEPLEALILNGDILDFSINSFEKSIHIGRHFFQQLYADKIAREIIYIPGNHDKQIWDGTEWDSRIIKKLNEYSDPEEFRHYQSGAVNLKNSPIIDLDKVKRGPDNTYGNIYLKGLFKSKEESLPVNIVYPNLYIITEKDSIIVTHGHMIEPAWVILSELLYGLDKYLPGNINMSRLEAWNVPVTASICTGIGQAKEVSDLIRLIAEQAYNKRTEALSDLLDHFARKALNKTKGAYKYFLEHVVFKYGKKKILDIAVNIEKSRFNEEKLKSDIAQKRLVTFYNSTLAIMDELKLPKPNKFIYGHTHLATPASKPFKLPALTGDLNYYNTGGWLPQKDSKKDIQTHAEVFLIDKKRFESVSI